MALDPVLALAKESIESIDGIDDSLVSIDKKTSAIVSQMTNINKNFNKFFKQMALARLQQLDPNDRASEVKPDGSVSGSKSDIFSSLLRALPALIAGILGAVVGAVIAQIRAANFFAKLLGGAKLSALAASIIDDLKVRIFVIFDDMKKLLRTKFARVFTVIDDLSVRAFVIFDDLRKSINTKFTKVFSAVDDLGKSKFVQNMIRFFNGLKNLGGFIAGPFVIAINEIMKLLAPIGKIFSGAATGAFSTVLKTVKSAFGTVMSVFGKMGAVFSGLAATVGKLFLPITIVMTLIDTVKETMKGFEEEGFVGGIKGAITGLVNSLIMMPLDLLKDLVSWVLEKLGFEEASKKLDSFSFSDMFSDFIDFLFDLPSRLLAALLPNPTSLVGKMISKTDTGKGLYDFAKVDPETGVRAELVTRSSKREMSTEDLKEENRTATAMGGSFGGISVVDASTNTTNTSSSSQSFMTPAPAAVNMWDRGSRGLFGFDGATV